MARTDIKRNLKRRWGLSYFLIMMIPFVLFAVFAVITVSTVRTTVHKANRTALMSIENELNSAFMQVDSLCDEVLLTPSFRTLGTIASLSELDPYTLYEKTSELRHMLNSRYYLSECYLFSPSRDCFISSLYYGKLSALYGDNIYGLSITETQNSDFFEEYRSFTDIKELTDDSDSTSWMLVLRPLNFVRSENIDDFCMAVAINASALVPAGTDQGYDLIIYDEDLHQVLFSYGRHYDSEFVEKYFSGLESGSAGSINGIMVLSSDSTMRGIRYYVMVNEDEYFRDLNKVIRMVFILLLAAVVLSSIAIYRMVGRHWSSFSSAVAESGTDISSIEASKSPYQPFVTSVSRLKKENRSHVIARLVLNEDSSVSDDVMAEIGIAVKAGGYCIFLAECSPETRVGIEQKLSDRGFLCISFASEHSVSMIVNSDEAGLSELPQLIEGLDDVDYFAVSRTVPHVNGIHGAFVQASNMMDYRKSVFMASAGGEGYAVYAAAMAEIEKNYSDPQLNVSLVADRLGVSIAYLSRCFKKNGSGNISDYLTDYRVSKAKELLSRTGQDEVPVSEVSNLCGFGSLRTFMRVFKACEGITPGQYRQSLAKEE